MLADELIATAGTDDDRLLGGAFTRLGERVKRAARFDLTPDVMRSAYTVNNSPIEAQLRALTLCRLPFAEVWFEWPGTFLGVPSTRTDTHAPVPKRMGALVTADESLQRGSIVYAWLHSSGANICPLTLTFDWRAEPEPLGDLTGVRRFHETADENAWRALAARHTRVANSTRDAVIDDNRRFGVVFNPMMSEFVARAKRSPMFGNLFKAALQDIEGEGPLLRAAIMLINSRNLAEYVPRQVDAKLNRARVKSGKLPMLACTEVRIKLTRALASRAGAVADDRAPSRLHLVRGHFKIRKTGVYWWSPHPRGHGEGIARQARHVMA